MLPVPFIYTKRTRAIFRLPTRTINPSLTVIKALTSLIVSRAGPIPTLNPPCSMTRRALDVLDSRPSSLIRLGAGIRPSASSLSVARAMSGTCSGIFAGSPAAELGGSLLGERLAVILRHDVLAENLLGVSWVNAGREKAIHVLKRQFRE